MIWTLRVKCVQGLYLPDNCTLVIEIPEDAPLNDLHEAILDGLDFDDREHLSEFFVGRHTRDRKIVYGGDYEDMFHMLDAFADIRLNEVYPLPKNMKLFLYFDFGDSWIFQIQKSRKKPREPKPGVTYPRVLDVIGTIPDQSPS